MDIDLDMALAELKKQGIKVSGPDQKLLDISRNNGKSPAAIYKLLKHLEGKSTVQTPAASQAPQPATQQATPVKKAAVASQLWTAELVQQQFEGKGVGRKTLAAICLEYHLDQAAIIKKLAARKISATPDDTLKKMAEERGELPLEVLKVIFVGEKRLP